MTRHLPAATLLAALALLTACDPAGPISTPSSAPAVPSTPASPPATSGSGSVAGISDWWTGGGQDHTNAITTDMSTIIATDTSPTSMGNACATLSTDISAAQSYAPIPDAQAQQHWSAALDHFQQAATDCVAATSTMNTDLMSKTTTEISAGSSELSAATARVQAITASG